MNELFSQLNILDIRDRLPRANWSIGVRNATTSITWHYNGPAVAPERQQGAGLIEQLIADAQWQMRPGWGGTVNGADGLMYTLIFAADGQILLARDLDAMLWHCAHADGNARGLALHFPLGGGQQPTAMQLASAFRASDLLRARYQIPLNRTLGHLEWKHATACPGPNLMSDLVAYRTGLTPAVAPTPTPAGLRRFQLNPTYALPIRVHQAPTLDSPVATRLKPDTIVFVDVTKQGDLVDGNSTWIHMARVPNEQADAGFISETTGEWL